MQDGEYPGLDRQTDQFVNQMVNRFIYQAAAFLSSFTNSCNCGIGEF